MTIAKIIYKIRRRIPSPDEKDKFDYEEIGGEDEIKEGDPRNAEEILKGLMNLCRTSTLSYQLKAKEAAKAKLKETK